MITVNIDKTAREKWGKTATKKLLRVDFCLVSLKAYHFTIAKENMRTKVFCCLI